MWQCSLTFLTFFFTAWTGQGSGDGLFVEVGLGRLGRKGVYVFMCRTEFEFEERHIMSCLFGERAYKLTSY